MFQSGFIVSAVFLSCAPGILARQKATEITMHVEVRFFQFKVSDLRILFCEHLAPEWQALSESRL